MSVPTLSIVDVAAFAAISSSGVRASDGRSACSVGRTSVDEMPTSAAHPYTAEVECAKAATAEPARATAPRSTAPSNSRSRLNRSPSDATPGAMNAAGRRRTRPASPTAEAPPAW
jgi:hypothetical protein